ncbi:MAG: outer membrane protein chaperone [Lysobacterales bacterium]|jgi:outer membrane protein|nr:MAG: outer membrane protein chaperone [Xanthomonadales bacterium]
MKGGWNMRFLLAALLLVSPLAARAQEPPLRIGYVDMQRLLEEAPQSRAARSRLEAEFAERDRLLQAEQARLAELSERERREGPLLPAEEAERLRREISALERSLRRSREQLQAELIERADAEYQRYFREITEAVIAFAREEGYDLVLPGPAVYAGPRVDLTDRILMRLRREGVPNP